MKSGTRSATRRRLRSAAALWLAWIACGCLRDAAGQEPRTARPNILLIVSDNQGWRDVGYHGSEIETPNIDRLARAGVRLESHYAYPTCLPARIALMTGRGPTRFAPSRDYGSPSFPTDTVTLARALTSAGYETGIVGKWQLGYPPEAGPRRFGFQHSYGLFGGGVHPYTHLYNPGPWGRTWHRGDDFLDEPGHVTDLLTAEAVRFVEKKRDRPFFLYLAYTAVHLALVEPEEWTSRYAGKIGDPCRRLVAASASHMDDGIGKIVEALERTGQRRSTLIVFSSDNGGQEHWANYGDELYGSPHPRCKVLGDNRPLRGWQTQLYEGGIRVPAFANWPGKLAPGARDATISLLDWMPTLSGLGGYGPPKDLGWEGRDVWPVLLGRAASADRTLYWRGRRGWDGPADWVAVRRGGWKLLARVDGRSLVDCELFDLASDPNEMRDLAARMPERVAEMRKVLEAEVARDHPDALRSRS